MKAGLLPRGQFSQERIVFAITVLLFLLFSATLTGFLNSSNLLSLLQSVSVLGILGVGMAVVVIGRGIDLSIVATMAIPVAWALYMTDQGMPVATAFALGAGFSILVGILNGFFIAYVEVPALFATLAIAAFVYGFGRSQLFNQDIIYLPASAAWIGAVGKMHVAQVPIAVVFFAIVCVLGFLLLRYTKAGRFFYLMGDNYLAARITGIPTRPMIVIQYTISSLIAFIAGTVTAAAVASMNTRVANSTLIYDVILVVVVGGIGLSGGKGGIRNVVIGTLLIGILLNAMTIMDLPFTLQNLIKSVILLVALLVDSIVNPRDEQTGQQGDI
ncbi:MAG TPA: ABC transporter permease [Hypericibacter adhaerens]|jgi:ribose transport system permease protein|uniref:ABC transporter permease n=1 Tax=Hypericibacter adhaerens TaxID=2602016 RepID=A0A5J6N0F5_9PROT|nr:ABC transporter permease [Hypericibacter adhaerens]QEX20366.1 ABC transporter permease [Hypericibacter adhaerens]HWA46580.1 ABC transporter permease [Hypericibacter adhaerens]